MRMEAAEMIKMLKPDAIVMDIIMPHADGLSLIGKAQYLRIRKSALRHHSLRDRA